jgi:NAD(P)-dependent dehydrogenase (short-subunit alcohol dehydrogenase family)
MISAIRRVESIAQEKAMSKDLQNKVAIITGGTSGIGRDTAVLFAEAGAKVVIAGRREKEGNETLALVRKASGDGIFVKTDVSKSTDVQGLVRATVEKYGRVDCLFNNAGIEGVWTPIVEQREEDFDQVIAINVRGVWLCLKYVIQQMLKQGTSGTIVNMSSVAGLMGGPAAAAYAASKHAVIGLTKCAALEYATNNIRVNAVCPAVIETPMGERIFGGERRDYATGLHPLGRFGTPREVAEAVLWMCSDKSSFMTGHELVVDGGLLTGRTSGAPLAAASAKA